MISALKYDNMVLNQELNCLEDTNIEIELQNNNISNKLKNNENESNLNINSWELNKHQ